MPIENGKNRYMEMHTDFINRSLFEGGSDLGGCRAEAQLRKVIPQVMRIVGNVEGNARKTLEQSHKIDTHRLPSDNQGR